MDVLHVLGSEVEQRLRRAKLDQVDIAQWLSRVRSEAETRLQALLAAVFLPFGTAPAGSGPLAWALGLLAWVVKIGALAAVLAAFESAIAKMRVFRVPEFLGAALLLALMAAALLFVSTGLA